jgi:ribosomal protein S18 acetylase RimI-like enzyme
MLPVVIVPFEGEHFDEVLALMKRTPGVAVREADSREATERYLERNPGLSFVAQSGGRIIGCAMSGHDGRRGYLQHVVVEPEHRGQGIAHELVTHCLDALEKIGILKTHIDVFATNEIANKYWTRRGWSRRDDILRYSFNRSSNKNA